jgi:hypothetical protein
MRQPRPARFPTSPQRRAPALRSSGSGASSGEARPSQTASSSIASAETITVTLPIHPLRGKQLAVFRWENGPGGRYALVEYPPGRRTRLPEAWTDRGAGWCAPQVRGREVLLSSQGLLEMSRAILIALQAEGLERGVGKLDSAAVESTLGTVTEHTVSHVQTSTAASSATLDGPDPQRTEQSAGSVGGAGSPGPAQRGRVGAPDGGDPQ